MAQKRKSTGSKVGRDVVEIRVDGSNNAVSTHGGTSTVSISQITSNTVWQDWRKQMDNEIRQRKDLNDDDKSILLQNVEHVVKEAEKGPNANANRMERLLNMAGTMAPDILDVIITTIANPLAGIGLVIKKIGDKAKISPAT